MRLETQLLVPLVSYGRAYLRSAIGASDVERAMRDVALASCEVEGVGLVAWLDALRESGGVPALSSDLALEVRRASGATVLNATLTRVGDAWRLVFAQPHASRGKPEPSVADASRALDEALDALVVLGARVELSGWTSYFGGVLSTFRAGSETPWRLVASADPAVRALAAAAASSDVFAGMGSWNDFYVDDPGAERERQLLSGRLHDAMRDGLRAAATAE